MCKGPTVTPDANEGRQLVQVIASVLHRISSANSEVRVFKGPLAVFHALQIPPISVADYLQRILKYSFCSPHCYVYALILIDRLICMNSGFKLSPYNVHRLVVTSVLLAAKLRDDTYYSNAYYSSIGGISNTELNHLEVTMMQAIGFDLHISADTYTQYKDELLLHSLDGNKNEGAPVQGLGLVAQPIPMVVDACHAPDKSLSRNPSIPCFA